MLDFTPQVVARTSGNTGTFASLNTRGGGGQTGTIAELRVGHGPEPIPNFLQIGGYAFTLASLPSGQFGQAACYTDEFAVGQTCTPYQSVQGTPAVNAGLSPLLRRERLGQCRRIDQFHRGVQPDGDGCRSRQHDDVVLRHDRSHLHGATPR